MLDALISSKTRIKLLLKFFLNSSTTGYLRNLEAEFGESSNAIRVELNRLEAAGMLRSYMEGNKKMFCANTDHPLFDHLHQIVRKQVGIDQIVEQVTDRLGDLRRVYLIGKFSKGINSPIIDLVFLGEHIDQEYLIQLVERVEGLVNRKIRYLIYNLKEFEALGEEAQFDSEPLLIWSSENALEKQ